jgi:thiol-disulfide isomerase/thioredoxin
MKNLFLILTIIIAFTLEINAQTSHIITTRITHRDSTNTVVKDSAGAIYLYSEWHRLLLSGGYSLRPSDPRHDSITFVLHKLSDEEKSARILHPLKLPESAFFITGEGIASFSAHDINGNKIKLKELIGKVVVLNFWFIGCPPCRMEIPELNKIVLQYTDDPNVVFIAIALDYKSDIKKYIKDTPFLYHIIDDGKMYADLYKIRLYPTNVVLDKGGKVRFHTSGYGPYTAFWIKKAIEEVR